jgi:hypothetical protein
VAVVEPEDMKGAQAVQVVCSLDHLILLQLVQFIP